MYLTTIYSFILIDYYGYKSFIISYHLLLLLIHHHLLMAKSLAYQVSSTFPRSAFLAHLM